MKSKIFNGGVCVAYWFTPNTKELLVSKLRSPPYGDGDWFSVPPGLHYLDGNNPDDVKLVPVDKSNWEPKRYEKL